MSYNNYPKTDWSNKEVIGPNSDSEVINPKFSFRVELVEVEITEDNYPVNILKKYWPQKLYDYVEKKYYRKLLELNQVEYDDFLSKGTKLKVYIPKKIEIVQNLKEVIIAAPKDNKAHFEYLDIKEVIKDYFDKAVNQIDSAVSDFESIIGKHEIPSTDSSVFIYNLLESTGKYILGRVLKSAGGFGIAIDLVYNSLYKSIKVYNKSNKLITKQLNENKETDFIKNLKDTMSKALENTKLSLLTEIDNSMLDGYQRDELYLRFDDAYRFISQFENDLYLFELIITFINYKNAHVNIYLYKQIEVNSNNENKYLISKAYIKGTGHDQSINDELNTLFSVSNQSTKFNTLLSHFYENICKVEFQKPHIPIYALDIPIRFEFDKNDLILQNSYLYLDRERNVVRKSKMARNYYYDHQIGLKILNEDCFFNEGFFLYKEGVFPFIPVPLKLEN
jgi:hypothetical protein